MEFEASRGMAAAIAKGDPAAQADWLWNSYSAATGAGADQRGGFDGERNGRCRHTHPAPCAAHTPPRVMWPQSSATN